MSFSRIWIVQYIFVWISAFLPPISWEVRILGIGSYFCVNYVFLPSNSWEIRILGTIINYANLNMQILFSIGRLFDFTLSVDVNEWLCSGSGQKWAGNKPEMSRKCAQKDLKWAQKEPKRKFHIQIIFSRIWIVRLYEMNRVVDVNEWLCSGSLLLQLMKFKSYITQGNHLGCWN